jgi:outer membrane protein TolC
MIFQAPYLSLLQRVISLGAALLLFGCSAPDTWYDNAERYTTPTAPNTSASLDDARSPAPTLQKKIWLPQAQEGRIALSLEQAVFHALHHNNELLVQRYSPLIAGTFEQIERGVFDPELFAELQYSEIQATETSRSTEDRFSVEANDIDALAGVRRQFPSGTNLELSLRSGRSRSNRTPVQQDVRMGLSVTQALLRGYGAAVNLVDIRQVQLDTQISLYELRGFIESLVSDVETTYWRYVLASQSILIFEQSLEVARQQLEEVENRIEVGVIPRNAAAAARAEVARREQALIEARSTRNERRLRLLRLLNVTDNGQLHSTIATTSQPQTTASPLTDLDDRLELALQMRPDLNEAQLRRRQQSLEVVRTRNGLLPKLDLFIDIGKTGYAETFNNAWSNLREDNFDLLSGIRLSSYLGNRTAKAKHFAARASRGQAQAALANLRELVKLDVLLAANEVKRTREQIEASAVTRMLEEQTLKAEQERFSVGDITSLLVAQAQRDLLVSQLAEIEAVVEYRIALVKLCLAEGSLLERRGIGLGNSL